MASSVLAVKPVNDLMHHPTYKEAATHPQPSPEHAAGRSLVPLFLDELPYKPQQRYASLRHPCS